MGICCIERSRRRYRPILQPNPCMHLVLQVPQIQKNLARTACGITIPTISSMSTIAHVETIPSQVLVHEPVIPFEAPTAVSVDPALGIRFAAWSSPVVLVVMAAEGGHQSRRVEQCLHELAVLPGVLGLA